MTQSVVTQFELFEKLGKADMDVVYRAMDTRLDRVVALKASLSASRKVLKYLNTVGGTQ